jgi:hypothetical protein
VTFEAPLTQRMHNYLIEVEDLVEGEELGDFGFYLQKLVRELFEVQFPPEYIVVHFSLPFLG